MQIGKLKQIVLPPGPILSLTLIGLLLLSALLYYRAIKIQRFIEPAIAISEPRIVLNHTIKRLLEREFGSQRIKGVNYYAEKIIVHSSLLYSDMHGSEMRLNERLGRVFLSILKDPMMSSYVDAITVITRTPMGPNPFENRKRREEKLLASNMFLNSVLNAVPELERDYSIYFESTTVSTYAPKEETEWVEFKVIHSDKVHMDALQKLEKYAE